MTEQDYVLGTHDEELARLGLQHEVWRPYVLDAWRRAGISEGFRVVDVGAGPGFASLDLAAIVGPAGSVVAVERSGRFVDALRRRAPANVRVQQADLMLESIDAVNCDAAWCRWVASFVTSPSTLIGRIASALRTGGVFVSHEYVDYASWRVIPGDPALDEFVAEVMASWRAAGGEPDAARLLPGHLRAEFDVVAARPLVFVTRPGEALWRWPASFLRVGVTRLKELGRVDDQRARGIEEAFGRAEADPQSLMVTPLVLEIIATKR